MADVTMIDTSVFGALNRAKSGPVVAKDLLQLRSRGELLVCSSAYQEIQRTPDPALKAAQLQQITDFSPSETHGNLEPLLAESSFNAVGI